ncbi:amidohydrolase family protein [Azohydromonas lata]|uniref:amidohydrolase family protein n=1 Tax=Azohydromonas lata TaxID=45677 RepID=UPI0008365D5A|nr:amidohydrolase family protein [Azohydromonas lata]
MLIDLHAHLVTEGMLNRHAFWGPFMKAQGFTVGHFSLGTRQPKKAVSDAQAQANLLSRMTHDARRKLMAERGVDRLVMATPSHAFMYWAEDFGNEYARICNDELSAWCAQDPEHFDFWAHANLADPKEAAREIERAVTQLGARGVCVGGANFNGLQAYSEELYPVWDKVCALDVPLMVHGYNQSVWWGERHTEDRFETTSIVGDCVDETLFPWYLICGGVLDAFPTLKTYVTHAGGMFVFQLGRLSELNKTMAPDARNKRPFMEYLQNFWFDLDVHHPALRRGVAEVVGVDRLVIGTNFGGAYDNGDLTEGLGLSDAEREKVRGGNALQLLKLSR